MDIIDNKNGIQVPSSFEVITNLPIDVRFVVNDLNELNDLYNTYDGLIVYVKDIQQYFRYNEEKNQWDRTLTTMISVTGYPSPEIGYVGDWALNDMGSLYHKEIASNGTAQWVSKAIMGGGGSGGGIVNIGNSYTSIDAMNADIMNAEIGTIAIINSGVGNPDNGKLFKKITSNGISGWSEIGNISGPSGLNGSNGKDGESSTIQINSVITANPNSNVTIENIGDDTNVILNISIPRGMPGIDGEKGDKGEPGVQGIEGPRGPSGTIEVGSVTTIEYGQTPQIDNVGTADNAILNFHIPAGPQGPQGDPSNINGKTSINGEINLTLDDIPDGEVNKLTPEVEYF